MSGSPEQLTSLANFIASHRDFELPGTSLRHTFFDLIELKYFLISSLRDFRRLLFLGVFFAIVFLRSLLRLLILFLIVLGILPSRTLGLSGKHSTGLIHQ